MPSKVATVVFAVGILVLFALDRDRNARTSKALWLPVVWMLIAGSRAVSQWLGLGSPVVTADQALEGSPLDRDVLTGLIAAGVIALYGRRREVGTLLRANGPLVVFFSYCAASIFWSDFPDVAFKRVMRAVGDLVMILIILTDPDRSAAIKRFLARTGFLLIPVSILLIQYYPYLGQAWSEERGRTLFNGVATNKNLLGITCMVSGLGCAWRLIEAFRGREDTRKAGPLIAQGALLTMVLLLLFRIDSMTSLACFVLGTGLMVATSFPALPRKRTLVHLLVASVLCVGFAGLFLDVGAELVGTIGRDSTLTGRTDLWKQLLKMNQHPLLGTGFESFWLGERLEELWNMYPWRPNEAHNGYLEVFLNLGWTGVALFALVIATGYRNVVGAFRHDGESLRLACFVAGALYGLTEAAFRMMSPAWLVFVLAIVAVPESASSHTSAVRRRRHFATNYGPGRPSGSVVSGQYRVSFESSPPGCDYCISGDRGGPAMRRVAQLIGFLIIIIVAPMITHAQSWSGILSPSRAIDWSTAGVSGGIPNRTNVCASFNSNASVTQIQNALNSGACQNSVVQLNSGTFTLASGLTIPSNVTLRGNGASNTILNFTGSSSYYWGSYLIGFTGNFTGGFENNSAGPTNAGPGGADPNRLRAWTGTNGVVGTYTRGATVLNLASAPTGLSVGDLLFLAQADDPDANVPMTNLFVSAKRPGVSIDGPGYNMLGTAQRQAVKVTAISGSQVTITPGVYLNTWRTSQNPRVYWWGGDTRQAGLEDLSVIASASNTTTWTGILFHQTTNSWVSGVRLHVGSAGCGSSAGTRSGFLLHLSRNVTIQNSYLDTMFGGGSFSTTSYGIEFVGTSAALVQNNILYSVESPLFLNAGSSGNVVSYNYELRGSGGVCSGQTGLSGHDYGLFMNLLEGNSSSQTRADSFHGTQAFRTSFRNYWRGDNGDPPVDMWAYNRNHNIIGNVLGKPGNQIRYQCDGNFVSGCDRYSPTVFRFGYPAAGAVASEAGINYDAQTGATAMRWGNYDVVNAASRFVASEVPSSGVQYPNAVPSNTNLPPSFYLTSRPPWFATPWGTPSWPPVGPDVTGGNIAGLNGHANKIPAQLCYENLAIANFNAKTCYAQAVQSVPSAPPGSPLLQ